jgi:CCR4-NOT transcription complex subunit 1
MFSAGGSSSGGVTPGSSGVANSAANVSMQASQQFSKEVEDEANSYFQRIYNTPGTSQHSAITIEQIMDILKNLKDSPHEKDKV